MNRGQLQAFLKEFEKVPGGTPVLAGQMGLVLAAILADDDAKVEESARAFMASICDATGPLFDQDVAKLAVIIDRAKRTERVSVLDEVAAVVGGWLNNDETSADDLVAVLNELRKP